MKPKYYADWPSQRFRLISDAQSFRRKYQRAGYRTKLVHHLGIGDPYRMVYYTNSDKQKDLDDVYRGDPDKACRMAINATLHLPERDRLEKINELLHGYGVEAIRGEWQNGYWCDIVACYVNVGDTYACTVMQVRGWWSGCSSRFIVTSYGDWIERNEKKYDIQ